MSTPDKPDSPDKAAREAERARIVALIEEEIVRGMALINLHDSKGSPFFDEGAVQIGIEVMEYLMERIQQEPEEEK